MKPSWLTSSGMNPARIREASSFAVVGITGMKDFSAGMVLAGLTRCPQFSGRRMAAVSLPSPLPDPDSGIRDATALDLARFLDTPEGFRWLSRALIREAPGMETILIPSILGTRPDAALHARLEEETGRRILELFCPPPSVTGLRLLHALRSALRKTPLARVENAAVVRAAMEGTRCLALFTREGGRERRYEAKEFIIASGGLFGQGIETGPGSARETIFGLPVPMPGRVEDWSGPHFFRHERHPFARMGVAVSEDLLPLDENGKPLSANVRFVGRSLGGYDYATEKSGSGVALATGHFAGTRV
jgi:glycerol-3-phosphate dehydrogenase subunit B